MIDVKTLCVQFWKKYKIKDYTSLKTFFERQVFINHKAFGDCGWPYLISIFLTATQNQCYKQIFLKKWLK